ncbi:hypothetical protein Aperf_G00000092479 [Anoplocephala perfoliata]
MSNKVRAQHVASFLEQNVELSPDDILYNLETLAKQKNTVLMDCFFQIVDGEYLAVQVNGERDPSECFDLCYVDDIWGCSDADEGHPELFVFRFRARDITDGESPNEVHVFSMKNERSLKWIVDILSEAVDKAKYTNNQRLKPQYQPTREVDRRRDANRRPERSAKKVNRTRRE